MKHTVNIEDGSVILLATYYQFTQDFTLLSFKTMEFQCAVLITGSIAKYQARENSNRNNQ
ncbi:MAG: hypothetical protein ABIQ31_05085 [Ferruginibacter sp.]